MSSQSKLKVGLGLGSVFIRPCSGQLPRKAQTPKKWSSQSFALLKCLLRCNIDANPRRGGLRACRGVHALVSTALTCLSLSLFLTLSLSHSLFCTLRNEMTVTTCSKRIDTRFTVSFLSYFLDIGSHPTPFLIKAEFRLSLPSSSSPSSPSPSPSVAALFLRSVFSNCYTFP